VLGFAIDESSLYGEGSDPATRKTLVNYKLGFMKDKHVSYTSEKVVSYPCSDEIYKNLSYKVRSETPKNLKIKCIKIPSLELAQRSVPVITFMKCKGKHCETDQKKIDSKLEDFKIWAFTMTDETKHTHYKPKIVTTYTATPILVSQNYKKKATVILRALEVHSYVGQFAKKKIKHFSANTFVRHEEHYKSFKKSSEMLDLTIKLDRYSRVVIHKTYKSYLDVFITMGGLTKTLGMVFWILYWPIKQLISYKGLINHVFLVCMNQL
jgi:hypothetical protein